MKITVHQSLCGDKNNAWDLLKTTMQDPKEAKAIAFKTDLHDTASGQSWGPSVRGFVYADYFLIMKSFLDPTAIRSGRAFSHVLIVDKSALPQITHLEPLLQLLPVDLDKEAVIQPMIFDLGHKVLDKKTTLSETFHSRFRKLIHGYTHRDDYRNTFIWVGSNDFTSAVAELWNRLTDKEKESFNFDIYFNANAIPTGQLNLICILERNLSKFQKSGYLIIGLNDTAELTSFAEQVLVGNKETHDRLENFANAIGVTQFERSEWDTVSIGLSTFENFESEQDIKKINTLTNIVALYSPSSKNGAIFKARLINKLVTLIPKAFVADLMLLRSFRKESFAKSIPLLSKAFNHWLDSKLLSSEQVTSDAVEILEMLGSTKAEDWMTKIVKAAITEFLGASELQNIQAFYIWIITKPEILPLLEPFISPKAEYSFVTTLPANLSPAIITALIKLAIQNDWYYFHANLLLLLPVTLAERLAQQLIVDKNISYYDALNVLLGKSRAEDIIAFAIRYKDCRLITLAAQHCHQQPSLLNAIVVSEPVWQEIWVKTMTLGSSIDSGLRKFKDICIQLFDHIVNGGNTKSELLDRISKSPYANILTYQKRNMLWPKLAPAHKILFLKETSSFLLNELSRGKVIKIPEDNILSDYIFSNAINDFLYFNRNNIKAAIPIFKNFNNIPTDYFENYLSNFRGILDGGDAKALGKLIKMRNSAKAALYVSRRSAKNNSWSIALKECYDLLSLMEKAKIFFGDILPKVKLSTDQWWRNVEELLCNYYSNPTALTTIWRKAGGDESELLLGVPARETWSKALIKLRRNEFKDIRMNALLKEVNNEFGHVEDFKFLFQIRKSHIKT